jgi:hypothetical protein
VTRKSYDRRLRKLLDETTSAAAAVTAEKLARRTYEPPAVSAGASFGSVLALDEQSPQRRALIEAAHACGLYEQRCTVCGSLLFRALCETPICDEHRKGAT